ncbi:MAG: ABC transporter permease, partial [Miltoncostaeaceae bacterium]
MPRRRLRRLLPVLILPLLAIASWQVAVWVAAPREWMLPSPLAVAAAGWEARERLWFHAQWTLMISVI